MLREVEAEDKEKEKRRRGRGRSRNRNRRSRSASSPFRREAAGVQQPPGVELDGKDLEWYLMVMCYADPDFSRSFRAAGSVCDGMLGSL